MNVPPLPLLVVFLVAVSACGEEASAPAPPDHASPSPTPPAETRGRSLEELPDVEVRPIEVAALRDIVTGERDKPRVVNFWATWCGPCVAEMPDLVLFAAAHPEIDVIMVSLDLPSVHETGVVPFAKRQGLVGVEVLRLDAPDPGTVLSLVVPSWPYSLPYTLVIDADGSKLATYARPVNMGDLAGAVDGRSR